MPTFASKLRFGTHQAVDPVQVRQTFEKSGPILVKLGQHLSLRPDLVTPAVAQELLQLVDRVASEAPSEIDRILEQDLGLTRADLSLSAEPVASGSLAEVFFGRTSNGSKIAVKIKRPRIDERVRASLERADTISPMLRLAGVSSDALQEVITELKESLLRELDFKAELRNLELMNELAADSPIMAFPKPYPDLSGPRVITMEFFEGVPLSAVLAAARNRPGGGPEHLAIDRSRVAENLVWGALEQIFDFQTFHADMHPGNIIVLSQNVIGFVDLGLVGSLNPSFQARLTNYLRAIHDDDLERVIDGAQSLLVPTTRSDPDSFRADFQAAHASWVKTKTQPRDDSGTGAYMVEILTAARRNGFIAPPEILALYRSLCTAELIASQIAPSGSLSGIGLQFFREQERKALFDRFSTNELQRHVHDAAELILAGPGHLSQLLADLSENRFVLRVETTESPRTKARADLRAKLIAAAIIGVAMTIVLATVVNTAGSWRGYAAAVLSLALAATLGVIAMFWRRLS